MLLSVKNLQRDSISRMSKPRLVEKVFYVEIGEITSVPVLAEIDRLDNLEFNFSLKERLQNEKIKTLRGYFYHLMRSSQEFLMQSLQCFLLHYYSEVAHRVSLIEIWRLKVFMSSL